MAKTISVCSNCGSKNVEVKVWVNPNDPKQIDFSSYETEDTWCGDCEEHAGIEDSEED